MALPRPLWTFFSGRFKVRVHGVGCIVVLTLVGRMKTRRLFTAAVLSLFIAWVAAGGGERPTPRLKGGNDYGAARDPPPRGKGPHQGATPPPPSGPRPGLPPPAPAPGGR